MVLVSRRSFNRLVRKRNILLYIVLLVTCVIFLQADWYPDLYYFTLKTFDDVSCYYSYENDSLPAIESTFKPPANSFYFHETSCKGNLNSRQACAVESTARVHPHWQINVLFTGPITKENFSTPAFNALKKYKNIKFMRLHLVDYARGTPVEGLVSGGALNRTRWRISHTSDVLRYLSLYKWGGVYLDLDVIVVRSFEELTTNWAARQSDRVVASGAMAFSRDSLGRQFANETMWDLQKNFRGDVWERNGPEVITRVLQKLCSTKSLAQMTPKTCKGFQVYGPELFYPISWRNAGDYFEDNDLHLGEPYTYHVWNKLTASCKVNRTSLYAKLAREYCPVVYEMYEDNFGL